MTTIYTYGLNHCGKGVRSPIETLSLLPIPKILKWFLIRFPLIPS